MTPTLWAYTTPTVKRGRIIAQRFVPVTALADERGFRSTYCYLEAEVDIVLANESFKNLRTLSVVSEELFLDFDDKPIDAEICGANLRYSGLAYSKFKSGNRSIHYHVPLVRMEGPNVPYSQREWVREHIVGADLSPYTVSGLWRLPLTWHEKNPGHRKEQVDSNVGERLLLPLLTPRVRLINTGEQVAPSYKLKLALQDSQGLGGRRVHAWRIGVLAYDAGWDYAQTYKTLLDWNDRCCKPLLEPYQLEQKLTEAWQSRMADS